MKLRLSRREASLILRKLLVVRSLQALLDERRSKLNGSAPMPTRILTGGLLPPFSSSTALKRLASEKGLYTVQPCMALP